MPLRRFGRLSSRIIWFVICLLAVGCVPAPGDSSPPAIESPTAAPIEIARATAAPSPTPSSSATAAATPSPTPSPTATRTPAPTDTPSATPSLTPSATPSTTPSSTPRPTAAASPLPSPTATPAPPAAPLFPGTPIWPFDRGSFLEQAQKARTAVQEFTFHLNYATTGGQLSCDAVKRQRAEMTAAPGYADTPAAWLSLYTRYRQAIHDAVQAMAPVSAVCDSGGRTIDRETVEGLYPSLDSAQNRLFEVEQEGRNLP